MLLHHVGKSVALVCEWASPLVALHNCALWKRANIEHQKFQVMFKMVVHTRCHHEIKNARSFHNDYEDHKPDGHFELISLEPFTSPYSNTIKPHEGGYVHQIRQNSPM